MQNENLLTIPKIMKKYGKKKNFKKYFKELCYSIYPFKDLLEKNHLKMILNADISSELAFYDNKNYATLSHSIRKYESFEIWPLHLIDLILNLIEIFKKTDDPEKTISSIIELFEKLLIF